MDDKLTPLEVAAFDGGMTDNYVDAPLNQFQKADNFIVRQDKTLKTRPGSAQHHSLAYRVASTRVGELINYYNDSQLVARSDDKLYYIDNGTWTEITGPTSNSAFVGSDDANVLSSAQWQKHLYLTSDKLTSPMKAFFNAGTPTLVNAGLPTFSPTPTFATDLTPIYTLAKEIRTKVLAHINDATQHTSVQSVYDAGSYFYEDTIAGVRNFCNWLDSVWNGLVTTGHAEDAALASSWAYHEGQDSPVNTYTNTTTAISDIITTLNTAKAKINAHDSEADSHVLTGLHQITSPDAAATAHLEADLVNYVYGFAWGYTYTIDGITYEDVGPITLFNVRDVPEINPLAGETVDIAGLAALANGATENHDTVNVKLKIYRTEAGGSTLYYLDEITNGTTTYSDSVEDSGGGWLTGFIGAATGLTSHDRAYTDGGVLDNDPPPASKFVHIENNVALWGYIKEGGITYPHRARQSVVNDPDSVPGSLNSDFDEDLTGINGAKGKHILFGTNGVWRRDGYYDELGQGSVIHDKIDSTAGCVSNNSCVQTKAGLFWAGNDGFYFTDGYQVMKISEGLETTYATITDSATKKSRIKGTYDKIKNLIYWTAQLQEESADVDTLFVLNLNHGVRPSSCFTTWSGGTSFSPTAICMFSGLLLRAGGMTDGSLQGYLFEHSDDYASDLRFVEDVEDPSNWPEKTVIWDYMGPAIGFGNNDRRKWVAKIMVTAKNDGDASLQVYSINNDYEAGKKAIKPIRLRGSGLYKHWARFPAGGLRCDYKQIQLTNAYTYITNSDTLGLATVDDSAKTATLAEVDLWPEDPVDYYISFESDSYATEYLITDRNDDYVTFSDADNSCPSGSQKWQIKGYPKDEVFHLQNYILRYAVIGQNQATFDGSEGENA